jgi:hypothetical protein
MSPPGNPSACREGDGGCDPARQHAWLAHWPHLFAKAPPEQHADYISPLPRFHPVPTRPVFAAVPGSHPPQLLDPPPKMHGMAASTAHH